MDYIKLKLGGKDRGLKFNMRTYQIFYEYVDQSDYERTMLPAAVWAGLKSNAYVKREEFKETFETVNDWVDGLTQEEMVSVITAFSQTAHFKKLVEEGAKADKKKEEEPKKSTSKSTMMTA